MYWHPLVGGQHLSAEDPRGGAIFVCTRFSSNTCLGNTVEATVEIYMKCKRDLKDYYLSRIWQYLLPGFIVNQRLLVNTLKILKLFGDQRFLVKIFNYAKIFGVSPKNFRIFSVFTKSLWITINPGSSLFRLFLIIDSPWRMTFSILFYIRNKKSIMKC